MPKKTKNIKRPVCLNCGRKLEPALECKNFVSGKWDEHTWKCECAPGLFLSIG